MLVLILSILDLCGISLHKDSLISFALFVNFSSPTMPSIRLGTIFMLCRPGFPESNRYIQWPLLSSLVRSRSFHF